MLVLIVGDCTSNGLFWSTELFYWTHNRWISLKNRVICDYLLLWAQG